MKTKHCKTVHSRYSVQQSVALTGPDWCPRWSLDGCGRGCLLCLYQQLQYYCLINVKWSWGLGGQKCLYQQLQHYSLINVKWSWGLGGQRFLLCLYQQLTYYCLIDMKCSRGRCGQGYRLHLNQQLQHYCPINVTWSLLWVWPHNVECKQNQHSSWGDCNQTCVLYLCMNPLYYDQLLLCPVLKMLKRQSR